MTQSGDPLENAIAERANGILKVEWLYKMKIPTRDECRSILSRIIDFYNKKIGIYLPACSGAAVPQHLNRTNQSGSNTVNQNSDSVKTFRDKKHRL